MRMIIRKMSFLILMNEIGGVREEIDDGLLIEIRTNRKKCQTTTTDKIGTNFDIFLFFFCFLFLKNKMVYYRERRYCFSPLPPIIYNDFTRHYLGGCQEILRET